MTPVRLSPFIFTVAFAEPIQALTSTRQALLCTSFT